MADYDINNRKQKRAAWLREHPDILEWLRKSLVSNSDDAFRDPRARKMTADLRSAGFYSPRTIHIDIFASMRRLAAETTPDADGDVRREINDRALREIKGILARPGVCKETIIKSLQ